MEKETTGTVVSVAKQWWLKVNTKPVRSHSLDGAAFPHIIKVKYAVDGKDYICRKWISAGRQVPGEGTTIKVVYCTDRPSKATFTIQARNKQKNCAEENRAFSDGSLPHGLLLAVVRLPLSGPKKPFCVRRLLFCKTAGRVFVPVYHTTRTAAIKIFCPVPA